MVGNDVLLRCAEFEYFPYILVSSLQWRYRPGWALASFTICLQASRSLALSLHSFIPSFLRSVDTSSSHLIFGLPLHLVAYSFLYNIFIGIAVSCILSIWPSHRILWLLINLTMFSPLIMASNGLFRCVILLEVVNGHLTTFLCMFLWRQDTGAQIAVNCVHRAHLVRTVLRDVTARMVPSAPVRMDVAIARQVSLCLCLCASVRAELMVQFIAGWREASLYCNIFFVHIHTFQPTACFTVQQKVCSS